MTVTERKLIVAIDGPAGSGKSTIASRLARKFDYLNLETGAMYRALGLKAIETDTSFDDETALLVLARDSNIELQPKLDRPINFIFDEVVKAQAEQPYTFR